MRPLLRPVGVWVCAAHPPSAPQTHAHTQYFWFAAARSRCSSRVSRSPIRMEQCSFLAVCEPNTFLFFLWGISSLPRCVCVRESFTFCFLVIRHVLRQSSAATNRHSLWVHWKKMYVMKWFIQLNIVEPPILYQMKEVGSYIKRLKVKAFWTFVMVLQMRP